MASRWSVQLRLKHKVSEYITAGSLVMTDEVTDINDPNTTGSSAYSKKEP